MNIPYRHIPRPIWARQIITETFFLDDSMLCQADNNPPIIFQETTKSFRSMFVKIYIFSVYIFKFVRAKYLHWRRIKDLPKYINIRWIVKCILLRHKFIMTYIYTHVHADVYTHIQYRIKAVLWKMFKYEMTTN